MCITSERGSGFCQVCVSLSPVLPAQVLIPSAHHESVGAKTTLFLDGFLGVLAGKVPGGSQTIRAVISSVFCCKQEQQ